MEFPPWNVLGLPLLILGIGCASNPVTEREALYGETLAALQENALTSDRISVSTRQVLQVLDLIELWDEDPHGVPEAVLGVEGGQPEWIKRAATAEIYYELADRSDTPEDAQRLYLEAVLTVVDVLETVRSEAGVFDPWQRLAAEIYNRGLARLLAVGQEFRGHPRGWRTISSLRDEHLLKIAEGDEYWNPGDFDGFIAAEERRYTGRLPNRHREFGLGANLIAERGEPGGTKDFGPYQLPGFQTAPATAILTPLEDGALELGFFIPYAVDRVTLSGIEAPLSADFSAPLGHAISRIEDPLGTENLSFFDPEAMKARQGIYMLQPYDPNRIPVLLVHGLWSSPITWIEVVNEIWGDKVLRDRFQIWIYLYPTGLAIPLNAMVFRDQLRQMRVDLDPEDDDPAMQDMVVIGHSMGGILTKTLVSHSGDDLWNSLATKPLDAIVADEEDRRGFREGAFYEPMPFVNRVVFIATPHRGAPMADNIVGAVGNWMISLPEDTVERTGRILRDNPGVFPDYESGPHTSIDDLSKSSATLLTMADLPIRDGLPYHSIMGDITGEGPPDSDDGVVEYSSSHLDGARSELIVSHDHNAHRDPAAQLEIRRILGEHLQER